jgi:hypothetical protein
MLQSDAVKRLGAIAAIAVGFSVAGCAGDDDGERKRAEAAAWCQVTARVDRAFDDTEGEVVWTLPITYDVAEEWVETAPEEIRASTEQAARILREALTDPPHPDLAGARKEIGAYAAEYCAAPARCLGDVEGNPRLPCIHAFEQR